MKWQKYGVNSYRCDEYQIDKEGNFWSLYRGDIWISEFKKLSSAKEVARLIEEG